MIELPEAYTLTKQINETIVGKRIESVIAAHSPHKFAWYHEDPALYDHFLANRVIEKADTCSGMVEISAEDVTIVINEGVNLRLLGSDAKPPKKHQLLIKFTDGTMLVGSVQMYGGLLVFPNGKCKNSYYLLSKEKVNPLTSEFSFDYFLSLFEDGTEKMSAKEFLATKQRIPGLGNGCLQDILFNAGVHPKRKIATLNGDDIALLFKSLKATLKAMAEQDGRDTESDLFGNAGGYRTILSKNTVGGPCPICGAVITKAAYLGGSIYYCSNCQQL